MAAGCSGSRRQQLPETHALFPLRLMTFPGLIGSFGGRRRPEGPGRAVQTGRCGRRGAPRVQLRHSGSFSTRTRGARCSSLGRGRWPKRTRRPPTDFALPFAPAPLPHPDADAGQEVAPGDVPLHRSPVLGGGSVPAQTGQMLPSTVSPLIRSQAALQVLLEPVTVGEDLPGAGVCLPGQRGGGGHCPAKVVSPG